MATVAKPTGDPVHDYLSAQIAKQFDEFFPRDAASSHIASERPAPAAPSSSPTDGRRLESTPTQS